MRPDVDWTVATPFGGCSSGRALELRSPIKAPPLPLPARIAAAQTLTLTLVGRRSESRLPCAHDRAKQRRVRPRRSDCDYPHAERSKQSYRRVRALTTVRPGVTGKRARVGAVTRGHSGVTPRAHSSRSRPAAKRRYYKGMPSLPSNITTKSLPSQRSASVALQSQTCVLGDGGCRAPAGAGSALVAVACKVCLARQGWP